MNAFNYIEMRMWEETYKFYSLSFEEGGKCPIYVCGSQVAQLNKSGIVYDDLHSYKAYALNDNAGLASVLFCAYMYVTGLFRPGEKIKHGYVKYGGRTKNQYLLEKYDAGFISKCSE